MNKKRDREKVKALEVSGWKVLVIWEHEIRKDPAICAEIVKSVLSSSD
jgi:G:T-mismatch repair DNA endonuclease (very short patch repair protein)